MPLLTPAQLAEPGDEHSHQVALMQWAAVTGSKRWPEMLFAFAVPNGGNYGGNRVAGARMRAEGLKPGVPDIFWPWSNGKDKGLWLELKTPAREGTKDGGRSPDQIKWHKWLRAQGWPVVTAYGYQAAAWAFALYAAGHLAMPEGDDCLFATAMANEPTLTEVMAL